VSTEKSTLKNHLKSHETKPDSKIMEDERKEPKKAVKFESKVLKGDQKKMFACFLCMHKSEDKKALTKHTLEEHKNSFPIPLPASILPQNDNLSNDNIDSGETQGSLD